MMRIVKFLVVGSVGLVLVILGVANMRPVTLSLLPDGVPSRTISDSLSVPDVPLSVVIFAAILLGVVIGELFEWLREHKHRREVKNRGQEIAILRAENARLKAKLSDPKEDLPRIAAQ